MDYANESHKAGLSWEEVNGYRALLEVQNLRCDILPGLKAWASSIPIRGS